MSGSALSGQPPRTDDDWLWLKTLMALGGKPDTDVSKGFPLGPPVPEARRDESRAPGILAGISVAIAVITIATWTRLAGRIFHPKLRFGWDDVAIIFAYLVVLAQLISSIVAVKRGCLGRHALTCTYEEIGFYLESNVRGQVFYYIAIAMIKISITLFNKRLTGISSRKWQMAHNVFLLVLVTLLLTALGLNTLGCRPVGINFNLKKLHAHPDSSCPPALKVARALLISHILTDCALLCVPLIVVYRLQMSTLGKLRLTMVFGLGALATVATIMRLVTAHRSLPDRTYDWSVGFLWIIIELTVGMLVASLPVLYGMVQLVFPKNWKARFSGLTSLNKRAEDKNGSQRSNGLEKPLQKNNGSTIHRQDDIELAYSQNSRQLGSKPTSAHEMA
ncbi:MAG: hypothetical protein M1815_000302 [Lichina confinis]|nr:MAG: hypothetical protein M1815_000302 [Lichina confinis]